MANKIVLKKSSVASKVPLSTDLEVGEIAVNLTDQKLYSKKSDGTVILVGSGVSGGGDVVGPASATDNAIARFDSTTGKLIQNSTVTLDDNGTLANVNAISLDTTPTTPPTTAGSLYWDAGNGTPSVVLNASTELQLGQENIAKVYNGSGATIPNGAVVAVNGAQGQRPQVTLADADSEPLSAATLGIATESIANGAEGFICTFGLVRGIDTSAFTEGLPIYLSQTAGQFTQTRPSAPAHTVALGWVIKANASSGEVFVNINNGWELDELHNVLITSPSSGNTLIYDATANVWKNANITAGTGISVTNGAGSITVNNTGVTSVSGTGTVNGLTLSGTVTTTGNLTLGGTLSGIANSALTNSSVTVNGTSIALGASGTITANTPNALTFNNGGAGAASGTTFNGGSAITISYNTVGAPSTTGTNASGSWGISVTGSSASCTGNAATATALQTARTIGGVSFNGTANINLPGVNTAGNQNTTGSAATLASGQSNWSGTGVLGNVVGMLAWKNYGNSHVIFDASQSTTPSGGACNNTNPDAAWSGTYPTLMGWNGTSTYGVRVDRARLADGIVSQANSATITASTTAGAASTIVQRDGNGYIFNNYFNSTDNSVSGSVTAVMVKQGDNYLRSGTAAAIASFISGQAMNINGTSANTNSISSATGGSYTWTNTNYWRTNNGGYSGSLSNAPLQVYSDSNNSAYFSFHKGGHYAVNMGLDADNVIRIGGWSAAANRWQLDMSGNNTVAGSSTATFFADSNNTSYYCNPAAQSVFVELRLNTNTWLTDSLGFNRIYFTQGDGTQIRGYSGTWYIQLGSTSSTTTILEGSGNFYTTGAVTAYWSDKRLKKNIEKINDWREILSKINGYRFEWNDLGLKILGDSGDQERGVKVGVIAQEAKEALPQSAVVQLMQYESKTDGVLIPKKDIDYDPENPYLTVQLEKYIPVLIEASKGLMDENEQLKATMQSLMSRITALEKKGI